MQVETTRSNTDEPPKLLFRVLGVVTIFVGITGSSFGRTWSPQVYETLFEFKIVESLDAFTPYFPLVPFYPLILMVLGAWLIVKSKG